MYRKFQLSCDTFWGFSRNIDIDIINNTEDIINYMNDELLEYLKQENMQELIEKLENCKYYISESMSEIRLIDRTYYLVDKIM